MTWLWRSASPTTFVAHSVGCRRSRRPGRLLPADIEVVATVAAPAHHLSRRLAATRADEALGGELGLAERPHPVEQVDDRRLQEGASGVTAYAEQRATDPLGRGEPLLDRHGHQQRGLLVGPRPQGGMDSGDIGAHAGHTSGHDEAWIVPSGTTDQYALGPASPCRRWHAHSNGVPAEAGHPLGDQGGDTVEVGLRPSLEDRRPQRGWLGEGTPCTSRRPGCGRVATGGP